MVGNALKALGYSVTTLVVLLLAIGLLVNTAVPNWLIAGLVFLLTFVSFFLHGLGRPSPRRWRGSASEGAAGYYVGGIEDRDGGRHSGNSGGHHSGGHDSGGGWFGGWGGGGGDSGI